MVPVAAVYEERPASSPVRKIRRAGQIAITPPEFELEGIQDLARGFFRRCAATTHSCKASRNLLVEPNLETLATDDDGSQRAATA